MAEMEMEFEMAPQLGLDGQVDDDLIDYDTDTEEQQAVQAPTDTYQNETRNAGDVSVDANSPEAAHFEVDFEHEGIDAGPSNQPDTIKSQDTESGVEPLPAQETEQHDASVDAPAVNLERSPPTDPHREEDDFLDMGQAFSNEDKDYTSGPATEDHDAAHEIDYDDVDTTGAADVDMEGGLGDGNETVEGLSSSALAPTDAAPEISQPEPNAPVEEDEITWVENDANDEDAPENTDATTGQADAEDNGGGSREFENTSKGEDEDTSQQEQPVAVHGDDAGEEVDFNHNDSVAEGFEPEKVAAGDVSDQSASHPGPAASENPEFPDIMVQYKGESFPLFSAGTDGFFSELSELDGNMETLLAGLRSELANEVAPEDELVFQVDEIGLEYSESCSRETLCATSLRQILEIFDLLVKNQDPDSSRTLYAYIFTKPSASKRFEYLVESATAGKGLGEVIHLFGSPNDGSDVETTEAFHEHLDEFENALDENGEPEEAEQDDGEENEELGHGENQLEGFEVDAENTADHTNNDSNTVEAEEEAIDMNNDEAPLADGESDAREQISTLESIQTLPNTAENARNETESNPFLTLDINESVDAGDFDFGDEHATIADAGATNSSTTNTLQNDDETTSNHVDTILDMNGDDTQLATGQDELAEIDWRDEPEPADTTPDTPSGIKRSRADDELGMGDEQDLKRRRP